MKNEMCGATGIPAQEQLGKVTPSSPPQPPEGALGGARGASLPSSGGKGPSQTLPAAARHSLLSAGMRKAGRGGGCQERLRNPQASLAVVELAFGTAQGAPAQYGPRSHCPQRVPEMTSLRCNRTRQGGAGKIPANVTLAVLR